VSTLPELEQRRVDRFALLLERYLCPKARVLEIGAGEGRLAARLSHSGYEVVALDRRSRNAFPIVEQAFEDYAAPAGSFDGVVAQFVLHHVDNLGATLEKITRLLRPGGIVAIDDYGWERSSDPLFRVDRTQLLTSEAMLTALRASFGEMFYCDWPYLYDGVAYDRVGFAFVGASIPRSREKNTTGCSL
jgi:SAM-dependent methyltransferase